MFTRGKNFITIGVVLCLLLLLAGPTRSVSAIGEESVAAKTLKPISIVSTKGSTTGAVTRLHVKDQTGAADNPLKYVLFKTPSVVYQGYRTYQIPTTVSAGTVTNIKVKINYKGPAKATQVWSWYLFDWVKNAWVKVGDNAGATANVWKLLQFNVTVNPTQYINNLTRQLRLRLVSSNAGGDAKLDYEAIIVTHNSCADPLGCVIIRQSDPIHIAYLLNIPSLEAKNGALIAVDDSNNKILNHPIKFDGVGRNNCDNAVALADSTKMRKDASILAIVGTTCSGEAITIMPSLSASGFSMVSPSNTNSALTEPGNPNNYPGYLRVSYPDKLQGSKAAEYAYDASGLNATTAATINDGTGYSAEIEQAFTDRFTALGGTIITRQTITPGDTDMSGVLGVIAASPPDVIYMSVFLPEGGYLMVQARATTGLETVPMMGSDALYTTEIGTAAGADADGFKVTGLDSQQYSAAYASHFVPAYTAKFGVAPSESAYSAYGYDAFSVIKLAIVNAAVPQPNGHLLIGRTALRNALYAISGVSGLTGTLTCTTTGDCAATPAIGVYEYQTSLSNFMRIWP